MEYRQTLPIDEAVVRRLHVGDILYLSGPVFTARDAAHHLMLERFEAGQPVPFDPSKMGLFHCGPIVRHRKDGWQIVAAGPTTSIRMEPFEARFLETFRPRIIIGKGGMGPQTQAALQTTGAVYAHYTGGAGALAARSVTQIKAVHWLDPLGMPEAVWVFDMRNFGPLLVTMDSHGASLYEQLEPTIAENMKRLLAHIAE